MTLGISLKMIGGRDLANRLGKLATKTATKALRKGLRAASKPIVAAVKAEAPVDKGFLKKAVGAKSAKRKQKGAVAMTVAPQAKPLAKSGRKKYYAGPVQHGHVTRGGKFVAPDQFMTRGFNRSAERAKSVARNVIGDALIESL